jgi:hypothetical protein
MTAVPINYLAVLACGVVAIIIGFVWYGPLFGKAWIRLAGMDKMTPEQMAAGKKKMPMMAAIQFVGALIIAGVLAHALVFASTYMHVSGISAGLQVGFWNWLGFVAPVTVGMVLWEGKPWKYWMITAGNWLVTLLVMGIILALWI